MDKQATLHVTEDGWELELADGSRASVPNKTRKEARKRLGLTDEDAGAKVSAQLQRNRALGRFEALRITQVVEASPRMSKDAAAQAAAAAAAEALVEKAAARAAAEQASQAATERRHGAEQTDEDLQRIYRRGGLGSPEVNAYTFLPYVLNPPTDRFAPPRHRTEPTKGLRGVPSSAPRYSGRLELDLVVRTPLCAFGSELEEPATHRSTGGRMQPLPPGGGQQVHKHVQPLRDTQGRPVIPGSSLKGVTRSWYEAITSSERRSDDAPVAWRSTAVGKHRQLAVLSLRDEHDHPVTLESRGTIDGLPKRPPPNVVARLRPVQTWDANVAQIPQGERMLARFNATRQRFSLTGTLRDSQEVTRDDGQPGQLKVGVSMRGEASIHVGMTNQQAGGSVDVDHDTLRTWYAAHADAGPTVPPAIRPGFRQGGLQIEVPDPAILNDGDLVWYQLHEDSRIAYLGKLRNGRWAALDPLAGKTPLGHEPPEDPSQLSPTHRVFGRADDRDALAGRVRFSPAVASEPDLPRATYTLKALSAPKLSSAGLYVDGDDQNVSWSSDHGSTVWLRGTKVYWHTVPAEGRGFPNDARVITETDAQGNPAKTTQNRTVTAFTSGTFRTTVTFEDLTEVELGALLLATTLRFDGADRTVGWKLGMGRPVGLGSLENRIHRFLLRDGTWASDPLASGWVDASQQLEGFLDAGRRAFLPAEGDRATFAGIAELFTMSTRSVGYPERGKLKRSADGESRRQPTAHEVITGSTMDYAAKQQGHH